MSYKIPGTIISAKEAKRIEEEKIKNQPLKKKSMFEKILDEAKP